MKTKAWKAGLFGVLALASFAPAAQADGEEGAWGPFTAGVALTSDYRFRGISQSDRDAAVQGWVQYDYKGFFGNIWSSYIDFNDEATYDSTIEVDFTAGYNYAFSEQTTGTIKALYYMYPDADAPAGFPDYDYFELIASLSHDFGKASVSGEIGWSPDFFGETGDAVEVTGGVSYPVMDTFLFFDGGLSASAHAGYQWIDQGTDYFFYDLGATAAWGPVSVDVRWIDTDLNRAECFFTDNCEGGIVLTLSAGLPG